MTKAEKIKSLETELKLERAEHNETKAQLEEYRKREQMFVAGHLRSAECGFDGYRSTIEICSTIAPYGAGNWDYKAFTDALEQFLKKWNSAAQKACLENPYVKREA